jgi:hypothetical protein
MPALSIKPIASRYHFDRPQAMPEGNHDSLWRPGARNGSRQPPFHVPLDFGFGEAADGWARPRSVGSHPIERLHQLFARGRR